MTSVKKGNHSILVVNILHGLRGACLDCPGLYEEAEDEFFYWLTKKENPLHAEVKALAWAHLVLFLTKTIPFAGTLLPKHLTWTDEIEDDLVSFIQKRWRGWAKGNEDAYQLGVLLGEIEYYATSKK
jgi:hypothetical protein